MRRAARRLIGVTIPAVLGALALMLVASGGPLPTVASAQECAERIRVRDLGDDGGAGQLRAALDNVCDGGTIRVRAGTITLQQGELALADRSVTIRAGRGKGADWERRLTIDAGGAGAAFRVEAPASLSLRNVTVTGSSGPGIISHGTVTLSGASSVSGNAGFGIFSDFGGNVVLDGASSVTANGEGGIRGILGFVTLKGESRVAKNGGPGVSLVRSGVQLTGAASVSKNAGSGIFLEGLGTAILSGSASVHGNVSQGNGGGIFVGSESVVEVRESARVTGNVAKGDGGGIYHRGLTVDLADDAAVSGNTAGGRGGGIFATVVGIQPPELTLDGAASVTHNHAFVDGGGIYLEAGTLALGDFVTVAKNTPNDVVEAQNGGNGQ